MLRSPIHVITDDTVALYNILGELVVNSAVLLCNFRCWWHFKCCFCGKNSALWQPCWIFSRQHDTAACELNWHGLNTLMQHCVWTDSWQSSHTHAHMQTVCGAIHTDIWVRIAFSFTHNLLMLLMLLSCWKSPATGHYYLRLSSCRF